MTPGPPHHGELGVLVLGPPEAERVSAPLWPKAALLMLQANLHPDEVWHLHPDELRFFFSKETPPFFREFWKGHPLVTPSTQPPLGWAPESLSDSTLPPKAHRW